MCKLLSVSKEHGKRIKMWYNGVEHRYIVQVYDQFGVTELIADNMLDCLNFAIEARSNAAR